MAVIHTSSCFKKILWWYVCRYIIFSYSGGVGKNCIDIVQVVKEGRNWANWQPASWTLALACAPFGQYTHHALCSWNVSTLNWFKVCLIACLFVCLFVYCLFVCCLFVTMLKIWHVGKFKTKKYLSNIAEIAQLWWRLEEKTYKDMSKVLHLQA